MYIGLAISKIMRITRDVIILRYYSGHSYPKDIVTEKIVSKKFTKGGGYM